MKKLILMFVMFIVVLTAITNLSSCKKKDKDPSPTSTGCATVWNTIVYDQDWNMEYIERPYPMVYRDTLISYGNSATFSVNAGNQCYPNGRTISFHLWNSDSSVVKVFDLYCPPNDSVSYDAQ